MEQKLLEFFSTLSDIVWGPYMLVLLVGTGVYLTISLKGIQFHGLFHSLYLALVKRKESGEAEGDIYPFSSADDRAGSYSRDR